MVNTAVVLVFCTVMLLDEAKFLCEGANSTAGGHLASLNWNIQSFENTHTLGRKITLTIATPSTTIPLFFLNPDFVFFLLKRRRFVN